MDPMHSVTSLVPFLDDEEITISLRFKVSKTKGIRFLAPIIESTPVCQSPQLQQSPLPDDNITSQNSPLSLSTSVPSPSLYESAPSLSSLKRKASETVDELYSEDFKRLKELQEYLEHRAPVKPAESDATSHADAFLSSLDPKLKNISAESVANKHPVPEVDNSQRSNENHDKPATSNSQANGIPPSQAVTSPVTPENDQPLPITCLNLDSYNTPDASPNVPFSKSRSVFVGNLSSNLDRDDLLSFFETHCGSVRDIRWPLNRYTGDPKPYAFVDFASESSAQKALQLENPQLDGQPINVSFNTSGVSTSKDTFHDAIGHHIPEIPPGVRSIYIGNLAEDLDEKILLLMFQTKCGKVKELRWPFDQRTGKRKKFAFIEFMEERAVPLAFTLNGLEVMGQKLRISFEFEPDRTHTPTASPPTLNQHGRMVPGYPPVQAFPAPLRYPQPIRRPGPYRVVPTAPQGPPPYPYTEPFFQPSLPPSPPTPYIHPTHVPRYSPAPIAGAPSSVQHPHGQPVHVNPSVVSWGH